MQKIDQDLNTISQIFKLGKVTSWESKPCDIYGFNVVHFNTEKKQNLKYYYKPKQTA